MKVLIADDDLVSRRTLQALLTKWGYEVLLAGDGAEAWRALQADGGPNLAILDWMMPDIDGVQVCRKAREIDQERYIYIILLTARSGKDQLVEAMQAGADDYVVKPFDPHELKVRVRAGRRVLELHEALIAARDRLRDQASHDPLTGLWNRTALLDILRRELSRSRREARPIGVLMADLDNFKDVNDTHGHLVGDVVLREVSRRILGSLRAYDAVGRYGGDEFICIVPGCAAPDAVGVAERLRAVVSRPVDTSDGPVPVALSVGVTAVHGAHVSDEQAPIRVADEALYRAKNAGRGRVELVDFPSSTAPALPAPVGGTVP